MMIRRQAIADFLNRELRDSNLAKQLSEAAIDRKLARIYPPPRFHTQPRLHQKVCFLLGRKHPRYLHLLECGLGKSKVVIDLFGHALDIRPNDHPPLRMLVCVPGFANLNQWVLELKKHAPDLRAQAVDGNGEADRRRQVFESDADAVIITYMGLLALCCGKGDPGPARGGKAKGRGWRIDPRRLREFADRFRFFCWDECDAFGNWQSLTYKAVHALSWSPNTLYSYGLTGTPFGKDPQHLWGMFNAIDGGETLGETLGIYRAAFFTEKQNFWGGREYKFQAHLKKALHRMLRHNSIRYEEGECNDLPELVTIRRPVQMPPENLKYYERLMTELAEARDSMTLLENAFIRLRTLCSGYLTFQNKKGERKELLFKNNPKLDDLLQFLAELPPHKKVVVFLEYKKSGEIVCEALRKAKVNHVRLYSGTKKSERPVERFQTDPAVRVLVSSSAGARGVNLHEAAHYVYFFEAPVNPKIRQQELKRVHRMGQTHTTFVVDCYVQGSIEQTILHSLKHSRDLFREIVDGRKLENKLCLTTQPARSGRKDGTSQSSNSGTGRARPRRPLLLGRSR